MNVRYVFAVALVVFLTGIVLLAACGPEGGDTPAPTPGGETAPMTGEALLEERCSVCHGLAGIKASHKTQEEWEKTVRRMVDKGTRLSEAEIAVLVEYLAATYK